jgi:hypothetical protein
MSKTNGSADIKRRRVKNHRGISYRERRDGSPILTISLTIRPRPGRQSGDERRG